MGLEFSLQARTLSRGWANTLSTMGYKTCWLSNAGLLLRIQDAFCFGISGGGQTYPEDVLCLLALSVVNGLVLTALFLSDSYNMERVICSCQQPWLNTQELLMVPKISKYLCTTRHL